ncbi:cytochrome c [Hymenobacter sp. BRD128]|uniref:c-type cytochrome n=1 Tax=Hymenobacter sp. BRD128 TaxID=2675878 RepID=UPI0015637883|nr:cytochrome c [Hymenobacter sp. BRD128]QKG55737.1 cytochrome c [Hymenobacter sp. BRD128]
MRTNYAAFALSLGMGLIVLLIGFLALNVAGLVGTGGGEVATERPMSEEITGAPVVATAYVPASAEEAAAIAAGDGLFKNNCAQCHAVNDKVVGPALAGIDKRRPVSWIVSWVHNSSKVIASGDEYAVKLFEDNGKQQMPAFPQLSETEIKNIVAWIRSQDDPANSAGAVAVK